LPDYGTPLALTSGMTPTNPIQPSSRNSHSLRIRTSVKSGVGPTGTNHGTRLRSPAEPTHTQPLQIKTKITAGYKPPVE
jgi:hypothetical protein